MTTHIVVPYSMHFSDSYQQLHSEFRWKVPRYCNIGMGCLPRNASQNALTALVCDSDDQPTQLLTYGDLKKSAFALSNVLKALKVKRLERVAIILPQRAETAICHIGTYCLGAMAMPMSVLFGPDALSFRFANSGAVVAIVDAAYLENTLAAISELAARNQPIALKHIIVVGNYRQGFADHAGVKLHEWHKLISSASQQFVPVKTLATDPAILIYTSGTTGAPKGAVIPHQALIGNLTGFVASQNWFPQANDVFWSPADWAWTGGLMDALLPCLYFKKPIVGFNGRFSPERAYMLLEKHSITNSFLFPTALKQMMKLEPSPSKHFKLALRAIMSAGESVGQTLFDWTQSAFNVTTNEMFGQTEVNYIVGNSSFRWAAKAGSIGRPYPGHQVAVIDDEGRKVSPGSVGEVAVNRFDIHGTPDPVFFLGYWQNEKATNDKFTNNWCRTGDLASIDKDGYLWYGGRADDMFKAAGYRIGPSEIENCLLQHPAVANTAVVPKPDSERGNIVKAFVVLSQGYSASAELVMQLQSHVRGKLAPYEYPKEIEFLSELPMTTTGKVQRRILRLQELEKASS